MKLYIAYGKHAIKSLGKNEKIIAQASNLSDLISKIKSQKIEAAIWVCDTYIDKHNGDTLAREERFVRTV